MKLQYKDDLINGDQWKRYYLQIWLNVGYMDTQTKLFLINDRMTENASFSDYWNLKVQAWYLKDEGLLYWHMNQRLHLERYCGVFKLIFSNNITF